MKKITVVISLSLFMLSGIYRHDIPIEKYLDLASETEYDCVGKINTIGAENNSTGSCVAIDEHHVLSVAHCFTGLLKKDTVVESNGLKIKTYVVTGHFTERIDKFYLLINGQKLQIKKIKIHEDYLRNQGRENDIAIIEVLEKIVNTKFPVLNSRSDELNDTLVFTGFGASGPGNHMALVSARGLKLAGQNCVDSISPGGKILLADFDAPGLENCNRLGDKTPAPLEFMIAGGDSGGGAFRKKQGKNELIGLNVYCETKISILAKNSYYCQLMGWLAISGQRDWIESNRR